MINLQIFTNYCLLQSLCVFLAVFIMCIFCCVYYCVFFAVLILSVLYRYSCYVCIMFSRQSAFVGIVEHVWQGSPGCRRGGSSKTSRAVSVRRGWHVSGRASFSLALISRTTIHHYSDHHVTAAKHTAQTAT